MGEMRKKGKWNGKRMKEKEGEKDEKEKENRWM
jgi:hypothetical protein